MGFGLHKPEGEAGKSTVAIGVGMFVAFGGILFGYDTGTISGILGMEYFRDHFSTPGNIDSDGHGVITASQQSLIVSLLSVGTFFGALVASQLADRIGRRLGIVASTGVFTVGVILQVASTAIPFFIVGRVIAGFGVGLISAIIPLYQSESSPKWVRGTIVGSYQLAITIGLLLASCANQGTHKRNDSGSYRIPLAIQFLWAIILVAGMLFLPETPRFHIKMGRWEQAAHAMARLRSLPEDHPQVVEELAEIRANHEYELSLGKARWADCFSNRGHMLKRLLTGCGLQALQQLTGINFIFYYGTRFFQSSGIKAAFTIALITNIVNVLSTFPGLYAVEKFGRRNLLLYGAVGMCIAEFIVAIVGTTTGSVVANKVLIAFVCMFIFFFASSWGPVAWVVTGEIFPLKVRAKCLSMTTASNWLLNFIIGFVTPYLVDEGPGNAGLKSKVFFIWGGCNFLCILFVYCLIYETKGLSLEQVDEMYQSVSSAWNSDSFVPADNYDKERRAGHLDHKTESAHLEKVAENLDKAEHV